jgi:dihydrodipicolinate synthase/N-acetylneuraminate lyase
MTDQDLHGIIAIPVTPFDNSYELDEPSLRRVIRFALDCGAHGLLTPVNASEWYTLTDAERCRVVEITLGEVAGAVPVIVGVTAQSVTLAIALARHAQQHGAAAVNAMPPHIVHPDAEGCYAYYDTLSRAIDIPVVVQNFYAPLGTPMSVDLIVRMIRELPNISYVKEETLPEPLRISLLLAAAGGDPRLRGVFGGQGGLFLMEELRRGAAGNMPAAHGADVLVGVWDAWQSGDEARAQTLHDRLLPLLNFERCYGGTAVYKEVMRRRGVIRTAVFRSPASPLDPAALRELERILADVGSLFRI